MTQNQSTWLRRATILNYTQEFSMSQIFRIIDYNLCAPAYKRNIIEVNCNGFNTIPRILPKTYSD